MTVKVTNPELASVFAGALADAPRHKRPAPFVRSILMVGALATRQGLLPDFMPDYDFLKHAAATLARFAVPVAPDASVSVCNIQFGHDFLTAQPPLEADLIIFCNIYNGPKSVSTQRPDTLCSQSPLAGDDGAWLSAIRQSGARYLMRVHDLSEDVLSLSLLATDGRVLSSDPVRHTVYKADLIHLRPPGL